MKKVMIHSVVGLCCAAIILCCTPQTAAAADLGDTLRSYMKERYPWAEVEVHDLSVKPETQKGVPSRILIEQGPPGRTVFSLEYGDGSRATATASVKAFDWVVMSRSAFKKGYRMQKEDMYATLMDVGRIPRDAARSAERLTGKQLRKPVAANTPLVEQVISETALVKRGQRVVLVAEAGGFTISTLGELRENAYVGSMVKVLNPASRRTVTGMLVDEGLVKVDF